MSQRAETRAAEARLILKTQFLLSANILNDHNMPMMFLISHIQNLCFAFLLPSLNRFECLIFSLGSNESEAEENEVDKPQRKKRTGPKKKLKAPQNSEVNYLF